MEKLLEDLLPFLILGIYFGLFALERVWPARPLPGVKGWTGKGLTFFILIMAVNAVVPALTVMALGDVTGLGLNRLGMVGGAVLAFLVSELINYAVHRSFHRVHFLWRWVHQLHHSAERLDMLGAAFVHPNEVVLGGAITTAATALLGVSPGAAALAGLTSVFYVMFQHCNVRTPEWLAWIIQRPEAHSVHHARGVHAYNYANFPPIDMLFGTFRNPREFVAEQGFWDGASGRVGAMLIGRDVTEPPVHAASRGPAHIALERVASR